MMLIPRRNFDIFEDVFEDSFFNMDTKKIMKTDIKEHDDHFELLVDLPGFDKDNIKISLEDGYLTIEAKTNTNKEEKDKQGKFVRQERYLGECSRTFFVGNDITEEDIKANYVNGTLNIDIPKLEKHKEISNKKYIEIK